MVLSKVTYHITKRTPLFLDIHKIFLYLQQKKIKKKK